MNKAEFLAALRERLSGLPEEDFNKSIDYYTEMIDDRVEDGMSEEEAVACLGSMDEIITQILSEVSLPKLVKEKVKPKRALAVWEIILIIISAPIWFPIVLSVVTTILSAYLSIWMMVLSLYLLDLSIAISGIAFIGLAIAELLKGAFAVFGALLGFGLVALGVSILLLFTFNLITKGIIYVSKKVLLGIKSLFIRK